ncbi:DUF4123 domain-containing protein [Lysobacter capsici]|uniref:DUF4123 domain-containing protein n=1 Tax=Lysobacter capsici TaxID=435897 RepID=UPI001C00564F|nr:DUF4123 domain-containing protein [Lysobacter capsici]QWF19580.1 DUF4123 domain-containing protein [Lysobacter capsici]
MFVDPLLQDPFDRDALSVGGQPAHAVDVPNWGIAPKEYPYFVALDSSLDRLLDHSCVLAFDQALGNADVRSLCGWFASDLPAVQLKRLFAAQMRRTAGSGPWMFRFFDPRVMRHLPAVFAGQGAVAGVEQWWFVDHRGQTQAVQGIHEPTAAIPINAEQQLKLDRIGVLNQAFSQWRESAEPPRDAFARLDQAAAKAQALGFSIEDEADCVAFMLHRCLVHARIEEHPHVAGWIAAMRSKEANYVDLAAQSDERLWADIESGHWTAGKQGARHG